MRRWRSTLLAASVAAGALTLAACCAAPAPASAGIIPGSLCKAAGDANGLAGKACAALSNPGQLAKVGKNLITGHLGTALKDFLGNGGPSSASAALNLAVLVAWVVEGARVALHEMGKVVSDTSAPQLTSVWFSARYWRMAAVAALLTLPFLFAAAVQAILRSDLSLLSRAAFGDLPLAMLAVGVAAPVAMLLLSGTDELSALVWSPSSTNGLSGLLGVAGAVSVVRFLGSPFLALLLCIFAAAAAVLVWLELAMREVAVYIVVLLLPLAFAALVWPARRVWAIRAVEVLVALILSKFAIVAVLGLGGAALDQFTSHGLGTLLAGVMLVLLAALAPWAVLRLLPLTELASSAAGALRPQLQAALQSTKAVDGRHGGTAGHVVELVNFASFGRPDVSSNGHSINDAIRDARPAGAENGADSFAAMSADAEEPSGDEEFAAQATEPDLARNVAPADLWASDEAHQSPGGRQSAESAAGAHAPAGTAPGQTEERVPGADPMWQAPDMTWRRMTLGSE
ncbi:MAG: hypothetical protein JO157_16905, partial [Acetobacteraceae bacterium]|nr:hypothetical protein [Acetobacteraceae bacterium]